MKNIFVVSEKEGAICAYESMQKCVAAAINRMVICGYLCEKITYGEHFTEIVYSNREGDLQIMNIDEIVFHQEGN